MFSSEEFTAPDRLVNLLTKGFHYEDHLPWYSNEDLVPLRSNSGTFKLMSFSYQFLECHMTTVSVLEYSSNNLFLASASTDGCIIIWNTYDYHIQYRFEKYEASITCIKWSPDNEMILAVSKCGVVQLISIIVNIVN